MTNETLSERAKRGKKEVAKIHKRAKKLIEKAKKQKEEAKESIKRTKKAVEKAKEVFNLK